MHISPPSPFCLVLSLALLSGTFLAFAKQLPNFRPLSGYAFLPFLTRFCLFTGEVRIRYGIYCSVLCSVFAACLVLSYGCFLRLVFLVKGTGEVLGCFLFVPLMGFNLPPH